MQRSKESGSPSIRVGKKYTIADWSSLETPAILSQHKYESRFQPGFSKNTPTGDSDDYPRVGVSLSTVTSHSWNVFRKKLSTFYHTIFSLLKKTGSFRIFGMIAWHRRTVYNRTGSILINLIVSDNIIWVKFSHVPSNEHPAKGTQV